MMANPTLASLRLDGPHDGVEIAYAEWGDPTAGRTVLCVHGLTRNGRDFDVLAAALAAVGAHVIAVDVPGRGRSPWLADPAGYTAATYAGQLVRLCELLGVDRVDWIGTSMGGIVGMLVAAQERTIVDRLVLNDVGPFIAKAALQQIASYVGLAPDFGSLDEAEAYLRRIHAGFGPLGDAQWRHLAAHSTRRDAATGRWRLHYDPAIRIMHEQAAANDIDLWPLWESVACPTLVLRGAESRILSAATATRMKETGPKAKLVTVPGVGHAPALMDEGQIAAVREWLGSR